MRRTHALRSAIAAITAIAGLTITAIPGSASTSDPGGPALPAERTAVQSAATSTAAAGTPAPDRARGVVWDGLEPGGAECPHGYAIQSPTGQHCTHGPDPADAGIDVRRHRSTSELVAATTEGTASTSNSAIPCYGDGTTGNRVQVVYAHAADVPDRFSSLALSVAAWTGATDVVFNDSAAETGGVRHVRWVTDSACNLVVQRVQLSNSGDDTMTNTINELEAAGFNRTDRKYLVYMDASVYCGISTFVSDDSASLSNANNTSSSISRVDSFCWGKAQPIEAHELMHALGGVQHSAPHSTGMAHCTDENDLMCYDDGSGAPLTYVCPTAHERLFDCNHDDYFSTAPAAGSYLASHWNSASSGFLATTDPTATSGGTTSTTSTTSSTITETFSGSVSRRSPTATEAVSSAAGQLSASLQFNKRATLSFSLVRSDGTTLATISGTSPLNISTTVAAGAYRLTVRTSGSNASFSMAVTHLA